MLEITSGDLNFKNLSCKTGRNSSTAKCLTTGVNVTGFKYDLKTDVPCHGMFGMMKKPHFLIVLNAELISIRMKNSKRGQKNKYVAFFFV